MSKFRRLLVRWLGAVAAVAAWPGRAWRSPAARVLLALSLVGGLGFLLWKVPEWRVAAEPDLTAKERLELENAFRVTLAQIIGGVGLSLGLWFAWLRIEVAREGQVTERFTRAIEQLGSIRPDGQANLEVRMGGIYALERIANDSKKDYGTIMEVLTAYVRGNAPWKEGTASDATATQAEIRPRADVQAVLTVLGRRKRQYLAGEGPRLDLHKTDLRGAVLWEAHLERADLSEAHLERAALSGAHLERADLSEAHLERAFLRGAHLEGADLWEAHLEGAALSGAHLEGAVLWGAHLEEGSPLGGPPGEGGPAGRGGPDRRVNQSCCGGCEHPAAGLPSTPAADEPPTAEPTTTSS